MSSHNLGDRLRARLVQVRHERTELARKMQRLQVEDRTLQAREEELAGLLGPDEDSPTLPRGEQPSASDASSSADSMLQLVRGQIATLPWEFTAADLDEAIKRVSPDRPLKRATRAVYLKRLVDEQVIAIRREHSGRSPAIYVRSGVADRPGNRNGAHQ